MTSNIIQPFISFKSHSVGKTIFILFFLIAASFFVSGLFKLSLFSSQIKTNNQESETTNLASLNPNTDIQIVYKPLDLIQNPYQPNAYLKIKKGQTEILAKPNLILQSDSPKIELIDLLGNGHKQISVLAFWGASALQHYFYDFNGTTITPICHEPTSSKFETQDNCLFYADKGIKLTDLNQDGVQEIVLFQAATIHAKPEIETEIFQWDDNLYRKLEKNNQLYNSVKYE